MNSVVAQGFAKIKYIRPVRPEDADGLVEDVYKQLTREVLLVPHAMLHSPVPELLAAAWTILRETLLTGSVPRMLKEAVAVGVSEANSCPYCVESHTLMLREAGADTNEIMIRGHRSRVAALIEWADHCSGRTLAAPAHTPFTHREAPELIGTAVCAHYFTRLANVFLEYSPPPLPSALRWARDFLEKVATKSSAGRIPNANVTRDASLALSPSESLPADLQWARSNGTIAGAFTRMAHVIEDIGSSFVPAEIRAFITARLARWNGESPPPDRVWATSAVQRLDEANRPLATLLLLTSFASCKVDMRTIAAARTSFGAQADADQLLIGAIGWAAFSAARRAATWLQGNTTTFNQSLALPIA